MLCFVAVPDVHLSIGRSDLPGYLSDSEADGVCVINYYHKQFKHAAKKRYFLENSDYLYFHSYMSDYFLGTYGGGIPKPFRYQMKLKLTGEQPMSLLYFHLYTSNLFLGLHCK
jgi:hypothetical protein